MKVAKTLVSSTAFSIIYVLAVQHHNSSLLGVAWGTLAAATIVYLWKNPQGRLRERPSDFGFPTETAQNGSTDGQFASDQRVRYFFTTIHPSGLTFEGFRQTGKPFTMPEDVLLLPVGQKRTVTICNLFANDHRSIAEIVSLLEAAPSQVIAALVREGLIDERRKVCRKVDHERRLAQKFHLPQISNSGRVDSFTSLCGVQGDETISPFLFFEVIKTEERCEICWKLSSKTEVPLRSSF